MLNLYEVSIVFTDGSKHTMLSVETNVKDARDWAVQCYCIDHGNWTRHLIVGTITKEINSDL